MGMRVVNYKPSRDIPKAVMELKTLSPTEISKWVQEHRTKKLSSGKRVQTVITPQAVTMWLKRNAKEAQKLEQQIRDEELEQKGISETLFQNGIFLELASIKTWILELHGRNAKETSINGFVNAIKRICMGLIRKKGTKGRKKEDYEIIEGWGLKHPDRLNLEDGLLYISELKKRGHPTRAYNLALRNFFQSKGVKGYHKISGKIPQMGKYAHLYIPKEKLHEIFEWLKPLNYDAYLAAKFAYKCGGCRISATLTAESGKVKWDGQFRTITVLEKATRGKGKRPQEKEIPADFWEELKPRVEKGGRLFNIEAYELNALLKQAYAEIIPQIAEEIPKPFHFMRHEFAQVLLRETGWNYGLVARLGHWTVETLERYYGKMDRQTAFTEGAKHLPNL